MAKILMCSYSGYGAWFMLRMIDEGHKVDYYFNGPPQCEPVLANIIPESLSKEPDYSNYDLVLFDLTGKPEQAERASRVAPVIGDGNLQSQLEDDRLFGIQIMEQSRIDVPPYESFDDLNEAKRFVRKTKKRYVFKPDGGQDQDAATTYVSKNWEDLLNYFDKLNSLSKGTEFILQEFIEGVEVSTEAYFNGSEFFLINGTLEEKKLMNDGIGPNTGCAGNLVWVYDQINKPYVFREGLEKLGDFLTQYGYRGMIDLNTIATATKLYGLEWTPRFGYDASATLFNLIQSDLAEFFGAVAVGERPNYQLHTKYGAGIRITIPPYPTEIKGKHPEDVPIEGLELEECVKECYLYDAYLNRFNSLSTAGVSGFVCVPLSMGDTIEQCFSRLDGKVKRIQIPDSQYRTHIQEKVSKRFKLLDSMGWLR